MRSEREPRPTEPDKLSPTSEPGRPEPEAAEVESARMLENQAAERLTKAGISRDHVRRLADEYIALDRGEDVGEFVAWARERVGR